MGYDLPLYDQLLSDVTEAPYMGHTKQTLYTGKDHKMWLEAPVISVIFCFVKHISIISRVTSCLDKNCQKKNPLCPLGCFISSLFTSSSSLFPVVLLIVYHSVLCLLSSPVASVLPSFAPLSLSGSPKAGSGHTEPLIGSLKGGLARDV